MQVTTNTSQTFSYFDKMAAMMDNNIEIRPMTSATADAAMQLVRQNLGTFEEVGSVLASAFRRTENIIETYDQPGSAFFVAVDQRNTNVIGCVGIGPLHGLPASEGIGEIREMVIETNHRRKGVGGQLLKQCLIQAKTLGYQRIYLETTPQMLNAQRLFKKFGFRPVTHAPNARGSKEQAVVEEIPCYFLLDNLQK